MPSGFTYKVADGTVTDFKTFALDCARAFGALIEMRDSPSDAPIPERFEPSNYHQKALAEAQAALMEFTIGTIREHKVLWQADMADRRKAIAQAIEQNDTRRQRYTDMLMKVEAWTPPTSEHEEMKKFMLEQLDSSLDFDITDEPAKWCGNPDQLFEDWLKAKRESLRHSVDYHAKGWAEDQRQAEERTRWLQQLRGSL